MNDKDRNRLMRLRRLVDAVPFPYDGTMKSVSLSGFAGYQADMREMQPVVSDVLYGMVLESLKDRNEDIIPGWDYQDPDLLMQALEDWVDARKQAGWNGPVPPFTAYWKRVAVDAAEEAE